MKSGDPGPERPAGTPASWLLFCPQIVRRGTGRPSCDHYLSPLQGLMRYGLYRVHFPERF